MLADEDLLNNHGKYSVTDLEKSIKNLNKKILLVTQNLTADFCVKYILDLDIDNGSEDSYIYDIDYIIDFQRHITPDDMRNAMKANNAPLA